MFPLSALGIVPMTPSFGLVAVCWIVSVCVHEFSHALAAHFGGDRSVRSRGYLSFDPLSYLHPVTSVLLPMVFLAMGGIPLPGGAVTIDRSALRSKAWISLVSAAGPLSNFLLFLVLAAVLHPAVGLVDHGEESQPPWVEILGTMAVLELMSVFFNLIPVPPLDGFGMIEPFFDEASRQKIARLGWAGLIVLFVLFFQVGAVTKAFFGLIVGVLDWFGLPFEVTCRQYNLVFFGHSE